MFLPLPEVCEAGGIGGHAKALAICDIPTGIAGLNGLTRWVVLEESDPNQKVPPLLPIKLLKALDAVIETRTRKLTLRCAKVSTILEEVLPSEHQTTSVMAFDKPGWDLREDVRQEVVGASPINPFVFDPDSRSIGFEPSDSRLCVRKLVQRSRDFIDDEALEDLKSNGNSDDTLPGLAHVVENAPLESFPAHVSLVPKLMHPKARAKALAWPKDEFKKGPGCWIRVHSRPRRALFTPTGTPDGPDIRVLSGVRSTKVDYCGGSPGEVISDDCLQNVILE